MKHYDTIFNADNGLGAEVSVFSPERGHDGFVSLRLMAAGEAGYLAPLTIRLPYSMAAQARMIADAINDAFEKADDANPLVESFSTAAE